MLINVITPSNRGTEPTVNAWIKALHPTWNFVVTTCGDIYYPMDLRKGRRVHRGLAVTLGPYAACDCFRMVQHVLSMDATDYDLVLWTRPDVRPGRKIFVQDGTPVEHSRGFIFMHPRDGAERPVPVVTSRAFLLPPKIIRPVADEAMRQLMARPVFNGPHAIEDFADGLFWQGLQFYRPEVLRNTFIETVELQDKPTPATYRR